MASLFSLAIQLQGCHDARDAEKKSIKLSWQFSHSADFRG
jgi:hypothetical protein